jgi:hypothetical protein
MRALGRRDSSSGRSSSRRRFEMHAPDPASSTGANPAPSSSSSTTAAALQLLLFAQLLLLLLPVRLQKVRNALAKVNLDAAARESKTGRIRAAVKSGGVQRTGERAARTGRQ